MQVVARHTLHACRAHAIQCCPANDTRRRCARPDLARGPRPPASASQAMAADVCDDAHNSVQASSSSTNEQEGLWRQLADAHAHPQHDLGVDTGATRSLRAQTVAAMGVGADADWHKVASLAAAVGSKVIPGFGIHPWWAHLHGSSVGGTFEQLLEAPSVEEMRKALQSIAAGEGTGPRSTRVVPEEEWTRRLEAALRQHPNALAGEMGLDRSATIPGTKARVRLQHQLALLRAQLSISARLRRPVSCHCVRGYGHMLQLLSELAAQDAEGRGAPPRIMLHSYSGSPEEVQRFVALPNGVGSRVFFSFSAAISARTASHKVAARIAAVPEDRLLLESDQVTVDAIDATLLASLDMIAQARGWTKEEAAQRTFANFGAFYRDCFQASHTDGCERRRCGDAL